MSSPAGVQFSQVDFLSRWMPSSSRAGVILSPNPDLAGSLRLLSPTLKPLKPDDSFSSDFAPLPASADSSCLVAEGCARSAGAERTEVPVYGGDEMEGNSQDLPLMMKLEQLRKWQQHMQQQLKAHQLEELLRLQEEQQRLLVKMNSSRDAAAAAADDSVGSDWEEEETSLPAASHHRRSPFSSNMNSSTCGLRQERHVSPAAERQRQRHRGQEVNDEDTWNSTDDDDQDQSSVSSHHQDDDDTLTSGDVRKENKLSLDRPIKPGIGGHKQTFEELLEEQLRLEEQRLKSARQQQNDDGAITSPAPPKRSFLKRGEGLSRFTNKSKASLKHKQEVKPQFKPPPQIRAIPRSSLAPGALQRGATSCVQRKTAVINKENRPRGVRSPPHHDDAAQSKTTRTKVLGNDQRQNTDGSESVQTEPKLSQNHKTVGSKPQPSAGAERSSGSKVEAGGAAGLETLELSLQRWECDRRRESAELGEFELLEQAAEELSFSSNSSFVLKVLQMDQQQRQLQAHGLHQRRLSSTPIKSPPSAPPQRSSSVNGGVSVDSGAFELKNKASGEDEERQDEEENCEEEQEVSVKPPLFPAAFCFPQSKPPYDKRTYQDEDDDRDDSNVDESTLMEDKDEDDDEQRSRVVFDDDDTWNDLEETSVDPHDDSRGVGPGSETMDAAAAASAPQTTTMMVRKVAPSKVVEVEKVPPPTTSQLMTRLFPSLKTKTQNTTTTPHLPHRRSAPLPPPESREPEEETVQQVQSRQLRERLVELEMEIDRFKRENAAVAKLRQDNEKTQENLRKERLEFERWKTEEQVKLEELKKEENKKLQKERKLFEKHVTAARAVPDKKEREEIQALKQQLSSLQEELRRKESRWTSTHGRLRQQIDSLSQDNAALQDQIHVLEKLRLSSWKKTSVPPEKETKDVSTTSTNVSSVTKGVKFASPLDSRAGSSGVGPQNMVAASGRRSSGETSHNSTGMKSSLRRPSAPNTSSSSCRRTQKSPPPSSNSQDQDQDQDHDQDKPSNSCSTKQDFVPEEPERSNVEETGSVEEVITHPDGKVEKVLVGGDRLIVFPNGTKKEVSCDGRTVKVTFFNGDTKQITADHRVIYHYSDAQTTHITYPDGLEVLHFPNNQTEKLFPDGRKEITFPDQTVKTLFSDGREESVLTDGTIIQVDTDGTKHIHFNTGQKEIHTSDYKRREYPDGTVKTVYTDGRQETRYPTGRVRVKDKDGNVVMDTRV